MLFLLRDRWAKMEKLILNLFETQKRMKHFLKKKMLFDLNIVQIIIYSLVIIWLLYKSIFAIVEKVD